ncbi:hypothetical protein [Dyadobacter sp.]|uniref:hypothetical protein n=1 Tax=Dyadobacter sp. TaxID=1914288 RepID=UPI003F72596D
MVKQQSIEHKKQACTPVRALLLLFFTLFLLSNCQVKKTLSAALLNHPVASHSAPGSAKVPAGAVQISENTLCASGKSAAYSDQDLHIQAATDLVPPASIAVLSYFPLLLFFARFLGDAHGITTYRFKIHPAVGRSPIYLKNRYLLI